MLLLILDLCNVNCSSTMTSVISHFSLSYSYFIPFFIIKSFSLSWWFFRSNFSVQSTFPLHHCRILLMGMCQTAIHMFSLSVSVIGNMSERRNFSGWDLFDGQIPRLCEQSWSTDSLHGDKPITFLNNACHLSDSEPGFNAGTSRLMSNLWGWT